MIGAVAMAADTANETIIDAPPTRWDIIVRIFAGIYAGIMTFIGEQAPPTTRGRA